MRASGPPGNDHILVVQARLALKTVHAAQSHVRPSAWKTFARCFTLLIFLWLLGGYSKDILLWKAAMRLLKNFSRLLRIRQRFSRRMTGWLWGRLRLSWTQDCACRRIFQLSAWMISLSRLIFVRPDDDSHPQISIGEESNGVIARVDQW